MKKNNHNSTLSDFIRYTRGEMTKREENAFQRKLQKDPFAEEASEGLEQISAREASADMKMLEKRLKKRVSGNNRMMYYRIAASIAVLMIISSVFIIINKEKPLNDLATSGSPGVPADDKEYRINQVEKDETMISEPSEKGSVTAETMTEVEPSPESEDADEQMIAAGGVVSEVKEEKSVEEPVTLEAEGNIPPSPDEDLRKSSKTEVRGVVFFAEDNLPVQGAVISIKNAHESVLTDSEGRFSIPLSDTTSPTLVAEYIGMEPKEIPAENNKDMKISLALSDVSLDEVTVISGNVLKSRSIQSQEKENKIYLSPQPSVGNSGFDKYIDDNILKPPSLAEGQKAVVILSFIVRNTGLIDSIKVIRTPGQEFSDEAVRLINEGPSWNPAEENGVKIDDRVSIRIVFR